MSDKEFVYLEQTQLEVVEVVPSIINVIEVTEASPGPKGDPGTSTGTFVFEQPVPNITWNIGHNLGFHPSVTVVDSGGTDVVGSITYIDEDNLYVTFNAPFGGTAYLS